MDGLITVLFLIFLCGAVALYYIPVGLWLEAIFASVKVGPIDLLLMRLRRIDPADVVTSSHYGTSSRSDGHQLSKP